MQFQFHRVLAFSLALAMFSFAVLPVSAAEETFGSGWEPKPLVDTNASAAKKPAEPAKPTAPAGPSAAEIEQALKPAEPFIQDVEAKLFIKPAKGTPLVQRLNTLQTVLFGEAKYKDAGELLAKLGEVFPQEAAKAQATLTAQMQNGLPKAAADSKPSSGKIMMVKPTVQPTGQSMQTTPGYVPPPSLQQTPLPATSPDSAPKKKRFWQSDDDWDSSFNDDFFKDDFFKDEPRQSQSTQSFSGNNSGGGGGMGSGLRSLGSGLAGLAALAGGIAGNYYLNKNLPQTQQFNNAYPYGYGYNPYTGQPNPNMIAPYGYAVPYGTQILPGTNGGYYGYPTQQPNYYYPSQAYQPYTYQAVPNRNLSPLGVPLAY